MMIASVRHVLLKSVQLYKDTPRTTWVISHPGQCVLNGSQIMWTSDVEEAMRTRGVKGVAEYAAKLQTQLLETVVLVRQKLEKMQTITINALIVIDVHARDVVDSLRDNKISDLAAFEWIS